jgi:glutamyl-Q tRNA(Asp) synthetase
MVTTRFAPSPTGRLHLGHAYAARIAHDLARQHHGKFLLRFEDIDHTRVRPEYYDGILEDLRFLELDWDGEPWRQLNRLPHYQAALDSLKEMGVLYPCCCTRRDIESELASLTNAPHGPEGPLYPGTCRGRQNPPSDLEPAWRLDAEKAAALTGPLTFTDQIHGVIQVDPRLLGDAILARKDIGTSYHLAVVIDDAAQDITHVTRGEDLLHATHLHRVLQKLLGLPEPRYLHHPLVLDEHGQRLAKRHDALSLATLRARGVDLQAALAKHNLGGTNFIISSLSPESYPD